MGSTTIKVSTETRDRIRSFGGATYDETVVAALDALERTRFWAEAHAALAWRRGLADDTRSRLEEREAEIDQAFLGIE